MVQPLKGGSSLPPGLPPDLAPKSRTWHPLARPLPGYRCPRAALPGSAHNAHLPAMDSSCPCLLCRPGPCPGLLGRGCPYAAPPFPAARGLHYPARLIPPTPSPRTPHAHASWMPRPASMLWAPRPRVPPIRPPSRLGDLPAHDITLDASRRPSPPPPPRAPVAPSVISSRTVSPSRAPPGARPAAAAAAGAPEPTRSLGPSPVFVYPLNRPSAADFITPPPRSGAPGDSDFWAPGPVSSSTSVPVVVPTTLCRTAADSLPPAPYGYFRMVDPQHTTWNTCGRGSGPSLRSLPLVCPTRTRMRATLLLFHPRA